MTLEEKIKQDLKQAMLDRNEIKKDTLRIVIGEIPRLNKKIDEKPTNKEIESIIRKLIKSETQVLELSKGNIGESLYINILYDYIPKMMSEQEIGEWITENIVLEDYNPKMKAMGDIMKALKGKADGGVVKAMATKILSGDQ